MSDKTNRINFYLIKKDVEINDIFKDDINELANIIIKDGYNLYYNPRMIIKAPWVTDFFKRDFTTTRDGKEYNIFNSTSSQAILIRKITCGDNDRYFAICFGTGYHLLNKDSYEPRFGLISALNIISEDSLRRIDKHDISSTPKFTAEQLSKKGGPLDFSLDIELDIMLGVMGSLDKNKENEKFLYKLFGTTISGKSNLSVSAKFDINNIDRLLKASFAAFKSKRYEKKGFDWIDKIELVKNKSKKSVKLAKKLNENLTKATDSFKIWLAVPELVDWQNIKGFYFNKDKTNLYEDVTRDAFVDACGEELTIQKLKCTRVNALHSDGEQDPYSWNAYDCLYAEVELNNESYILINSEWYRLKADFVENTNNKYNNIISNHTSSIEFKSYKEIDNDENGYNKRMNDNIPNAVCMDAENIQHGGGYSKIEFCDIFDKENKSIIHIKKYSGSSVLSHLFAQGFVSAQLLLNDKEFKRKVEDKIKEISGSEYSFGSDLKKYNFVFGIIAKPDKKEIPFFSKVKLNNTFNKITNVMGYNASIAFIDNNAPIKKTKS